MGIEIHNSRPCPRVLLKKEIFRNYPVGEKTALAEDGKPTSATRQPGRCCATGCQVPEGSIVAGRIAADD